jgi:hypothetical protein
VDDGGLKGYIAKQEAVFEDKGENTGSRPTSFYSLGNAVMTPDANRKASVRYTPLGGPVSLELADAEGNTWRLDIPENALPYGETITMQLMNSIQSGVVSGKLNSGIILQPEGLQFTIPAALTITGHKAADKSYVFSGNKAGENLNFDSRTVKGNKLTVEVEHFSSYIVYTPTTAEQFQQAQEMAAASYKEVLKEVKAFLKTPISLPPIPPDYTFICKEEDGENASTVRNRALDMYIESVLQPEKDLIITFSCWTRGKYIGPGAGCFLLCRPFTNEKC